MDEEQREERRAWVRTVLTDDEALLRGALADDVNWFRTDTERVACIIRAVFGMNE